MRRLLVTITCVLQGAMLVIVSGCGVTDRQLADFAASTAIRVLVSTGASIFQSVILEQFGGA